MKELTSREMEVLRLIATGSSDKQIAGQLGIAQGTSNKHREAIMIKTNARGIVKLTHWALSRGVVNNLYG
jgi:DNA-binding NarL/FixJ family response regulator